MACFKLISSLCVSLIFVSITAALNSNNRQCSNETNVGEPLFLTPLINGGKISLAQKLSGVEPFPGFYYKSHSGFITIEDNYFSNMFFWFIRAKENPETAPCILSFNGGPGISAMYGLFGEIGPFSLNSRLWLEKRDYNWVENYNVLFVDIPIGTGYSFTNDSRGYPSNDTDAATQAFKFLAQFFKLFPELTNNGLYIAAQSYSGKIVGILGNLIHHDTSNIMKLKGVIVMSGFLNPLAITKTFGTDWFNTGVIDGEQKKIIEENVDEFERLYNEGKRSEALSLVAKLFYATFHDTLITYFTQFTGMTDGSNLISSNLPAVFIDYKDFVQCNSIRKRLHVGNSTFRTGSEVVKALSNGLFDSAISYFDFLLNNGHKVLWLFGNMDIIVTPASADIMVSQLNWSGMKGFKQAERLIWRVCNDTELAGYVKSASNFTFVMIRNAGHMAPHDEPRAALCALDQFIGMKSCRC